MRQKAPERVQRVGVDFNQALILTDCTSSIGINNGGELTLTNSTITDGGNYGLYIDEANISLSFSGNTFNGNQTAPAFIPFTNIGAIDSGSSFASGTFVKIWNANPSSGSFTIEALSNDVPYRIAGTPGLDGNVEVTIDPGVEMEFTANSNITVNSNDAALIASGTSGNEITMTATPGNKTQGWWQGIGFYSNNPKNELNYVTLEYAGSSTWGSMSAAANVGLNRDAELNLNNSTITNSGQHGVYCDESAATVTGSGNTYSNNAGQDTQGCGL